MGSCSSCCEDDTTIIKRRQTSTVEPLVPSISTAQVLSPVVDSLLRKSDLEKVKKRGVLQGQHKARLSDLYDGDTMTVVVSFDGKELESLIIRIWGMDCPEMKGPTKKAGQEAKDEALRFLGASGVIGKPARKQTRDWFNQNAVMIDVEFVPVKEKWGRYLAKVSINGKDLAGHLVGKGLAKAYDGGKKDQDEWEDTPTGDK